MSEKITNKSKNTRTPDSQPSKPTEKGEILERGTVKPEIKSLPGESVTNYEKPPKPKK